MTSLKQQAANRANAQRNTGPRTAAGKSRSRHNAFRHGLAVPTAALPELAATAAALAQSIVGPGSPAPEVHEAASRVAEPTIDLRRVRTARLVLLDRITQDHDSALDPTPEPELERPARPTISMATRVKAFQDGTHDALRQAELAQIMAETHYEAEVERRQEHRAQAQESRRRHAVDWDQLCKLDRYERRALSRQHRAIRDLDAARSAP
jgi:hypothetical protein